MGACRHFVKQRERVDIYLGEYLVSACLGLNHRLIHLLGLIEMFASVLIVAGKDYTVFPVAFVIVGYIGAEFFDSHLRL